MGMDVTGRDPVIRSEEPVLIDWKNATETEKLAYNKEKNEWYTTNPGVYFRANLWSWRPLAEIIKKTNEIYDLGIDEQILTGIHENSGYGLKTQEECTALADAMTKFIESEFKDWECVGANYGMFTRKEITEDGSIIEQTIFSDDKLKEVEEKIAIHLGDKLFIKDGKFEVDDIIYKTAHATWMAHITEWITFLRECGGFRVF